MIFKSIGLLYALLVFFCMFFFLPGLTTIPAFDQDEARFTQASKQMLETHDYGQIYFQNIPRHLKPPGIYWLQAGATAFFGHGNLDSVCFYRIPSVIGGLLAVLFLYVFFSGGSDREQAFFAATILSSTLLLVVESHLGTTDAVLLASTVLMQGALWRIYVEYKKLGYAAWYWVFLFWLGMALGIFIKGISPIIGLLTLIGISIADRSFKFFKHVHVVLGLSGVVFSALLWIIPFSKAGHSDFLMDMLYQDALPKILGSAQGHGAPPGYFLILLPILFWPCSLLLFRAGVLAWRHRKEYLYRFLWSWILPVWVFIACVHTKLPEYALPLFPVLALFVAGVCVHDLKLSGILKKIDLLLRIVWLCVTLGMAVVFPVISYIFLNRIIVVAILLCMLVTTLGITAFILSNKSYHRCCISVSIVGSLCVYGLILQFFLSAIQPLWITQKIQQMLQQQSVVLSSRDPLYVVDYEEPSMVFYLGTKKVRFVSLAMIATMIKTHRIHYALMNEKDVPQVASIKILATIDGFNYERGNFVQLSLVRGV